MDDSYMQLCSTYARAVGRRDYASCRCHYGRTLNPIGPAAGGDFSVWNRSSQPTACCDSARSLLLTLALLRGPGQWLHPQQLWQPTLQQRQAALRRVCVMAAPEAAAPAAVAAASGAAAANAAENLRRIPAVSLDPLQLQERI